MVELYAADISALADPKEHAEYLEGLSENRIEKILKQKTQKGRVQSLGAGLLLKNVLERYGVSEHQIWTDEKGKHHAPGICFNLSHTEGLAICVIGREDVGCDVEYQKKAPASVAKHFFTESENSYLKEQEDYDREFFRIWTMRESYMKMTGDGLRVAFHKYEMRLEDGKFWVYCEGKKEDCYLREYDVPGYQVTICTKETESADTIQFVNVGEKYNEQYK